MANFFPKWSNTVPIKMIIALVVLVSTAIAGVTYYLTPQYSRVGYMPSQPVAFSHHLHSEQLGIDCRYCHSNVEKSGHSNVPAASTCMNCHNQIQTDSPALAEVRNSWESGETIDWVRIHKVPDYVYFNHAVHVNRGVSCVHCHGEVNRMEEVYHAKRLSMSWCLECHREPEKFLRENDKVYDLDWEPESAQAQLELGTRLVEQWHVNPPLSCSGCHR